jgi:kynurenine formamidase
LCCCAVHFIDVHTGTEISRHDPFTPRKITAEEIKACAKAQGVELKYGDIFIVRTGFSEAYRKVNKKQREETGAKAYLELAGLSRAHEMVELLHDNYYSAVASDAPSFETWPMDEPEHLHHWLLPLWDSPIGGLWDLEELAALCKKHNWYTFFPSSSPANVKGEIVSHSSSISFDQVELEAASLDKCSGIF